MMVYEVVLPAGTVVGFFMQHVNEATPNRQPIGPTHLTACARPTDGNCSICQCNDAGEWVRVDCGDMFHKECLNKWHSASCPNCRRVFPHE